MAPSSPAGRPSTAVNPLYKELEAKVKAAVEPLAPTASGPDARRFEPALLISDKAVASCCSRQYTYASL